MTEADEGVPEGVEIRPVMSVEPAVLREIAALGMVAWGREPSAGETAKRARQLEQEILALEPAERILLAASSAGRIVGFVRLTRDSDDPLRWCLVGLVVHPEHRRQGIATALVRACIAGARDYGAKSIRSETHSDNQASIRFHEGIGFDSQGRFTAPDGDEIAAFRLSL